MTGANVYDIKITAEILPGKDAALYKSGLELVVNSVLAKIPGRCAVWGLSSELYKR